MTTGGSYEAYVLWFMDIMADSAESGGSHEEDIVWRDTTAKAIRSLGKDSAMDAIAEAYRRRYSGVYL